MVDITYMGDALFFREVNTEHVGLARRTVVFAVTLPYQLLRVEQVGAIAAPWVFNGILAEVPADESCAPGIAFRQAYIMQVHFDGLTVVIAGELAHADLRGIAFSDFRAGQITRLSTTSANSSTK